MVLNNDWHKSWLRQDEIDTIVEIHFTDGTSIKRTRGSKNSVEVVTSGNSNVWSGFGNTYPDEVKYVGMFRDGVEHGQGTVTFSDGFKYEGEFVEGRPFGFEKDIKDEEDTQAA